MRCCVGAREQRQIVMAWPHWSRPLLALVAVLSGGAWRCYGSQLSLRLHIVEPADGGRVASAEGCITVAVAGDVPAGASVCMDVAVTESGASGVSTPGQCAPYDGGGIWRAGWGLVPGLQGRLTFTCWIATTHGEIEEGTLDSAVVDIAGAGECLGPPWTGARRSTPRRVIDTFPYFDEEDMALLRLVELDGLVDRVVVCESTLTHMGAPTGAPRFNASSPAFKQYGDKVVHVVLQPFGDDQWSREHNVRTMCGEIAASIVFDASDLVIHADVDEIPRRETVEMLRWCPNDATFPVQLSFEMSRHAPSWVLTQPWRGASVLLRHSLAPPSEVRMQSYRDCRECGGQPHYFRRATGGGDPVRVSGCTLPREASLRLQPHAGWHLSSFRAPARLVEKYRAFAHGDEPVFVRWNDGSTCWTLLQHGREPFTVTGGVGVRFDGMVLDMPRGWWNYSLPVQRFSTAGVVDEVMGWRTAVRNSELLDEPSHEAVEAACGALPHGWSRAPRVRPHAGDTSNAPGSAMISGLLALLTESWAGAHGTPTSGRWPFTVAIVAALETPRCSLLPGVIEALHDFALNVADPDSAASTGAAAWGLRVILLPALHADGSEGEFSECARALPQRLRFPHTVRMSQRVASRRFSGATLASVLEETYVDDLQPGSIDAVVFVFADGAGAANAATAREVGAVNPLVLRGLRPGGMVLALAANASKLATSVWPLVLRELENRPAEHVLGTTDLRVSIGRLEGSPRPVPDVVRHVLAGAEVPTASTVPVPSVARTGSNGFCAVTTRVDDVWLVRYQVR